MWDMRILPNLKLALLWRSREWYDIADIFHAGDIHYQSFKSHSETSMWYATIFAQI